MTETERLAKVALGLLAVAESAALARGHRRTDAVGRLYLDARAAFRKAAERATGARHG